MQKSTGKKLQVGLLMIFFQRFMNEKSGTKVAGKNSVGYDFNQSDITLQTAAGDGQYVSRWLYSIVPWSAFRKQGAFRLSYCFL